MTSKNHKLSLFIFRRDLRLHDNTGLITACKHSEKVIPCFIFDDRQIKKNNYFSEKSFTFLLKSLEDLQTQLKKKKAKLYFFNGNAEIIVKQLLKKLPIDAVYINRDYTPFSIKRDRAIEKAAQQADAEFFQCADSLLHEPEEITKKDGSPYSIYTPFMKRSKQLPVRKPQKNTFSNYYKKNIVQDNKNIFKQLMKKFDQNLCIPAGTQGGKKCLKRIATLKNSHKKRDIPSLDATSHLSAHNKYGTISIREVYYKILDTFSKSHTMINELYWRDFFTHIAFHFPFVFKGAFHNRYNRIPWSQSKKKFNAWCQGKTGFPIVDAGMRELNETGMMHNRVRLITASFLVKDLHINWQWGERYFAQHLLDYDAAVNNGNWQWCASTGCDAQPYFRIFNPWLQQKRYDPNADYIKQWVGELEDIDPRTLHKPDLLSKATIKNYPKPIVDHQKESNKAKKDYKKM